jgi:hypothetical protein
MGDGGFSISQGDSMSDDDSYLLPGPPTDPDHPWRRLVRLVARLLAEKKLIESHENPENQNDLEGQMPVD